MTANHTWLELNIYLTFCSGSNFQIKKKKYNIVKNLKNIKNEFYRKNRISYVISENNI